MCYLRLLFHLAIICLIIGLDYFDLDEYINSTLNMMFLSIIGRNTDFCHSLHIPIVEESSPLRGNLNKTS